MLTVRLLLAALFFSSSAFGHAAVWHCTVRNTYEVSAGALKKPKESSFEPTQVGDMLLYDEASGSVRHQRGARTTWSLTFNPWQKGSEQNSAIALFANRGIAADPVMVLRIFGYRKEEAITAKSFSFMDEDGSIGTGTCAQLADR